MRNRIPILKVLLNLLPPSDTYEGRLLEVATGTGALMEVVAPAFPMLKYQPSEYVPEVPAAPEEQWSMHGKIGLRAELDELENIDSRGVKLFKNVLGAVAVDLSDDDFPEVILAEMFDVVVCCNTLHITPWVCSVNLFKNAGKHLNVGGCLVVYGPFKVSGSFIGDDGGEGNRKFDEKLRATNDAWAIRDVGDLVKLAETVGLELKNRVDMPSNNLTLRFVKV